MKGIKKTSKGNLIISEIVHLRDVEMAYVRWVRDRLATDPDADPFTLRERIATAIGVTTRTIYNYVYRGYLGDIPSRPAGRR